MKLIEIFFFKLKFIHIIQLLISYHRSSEYYDIVLILPYSSDSGFHHSLTVSNGLCILPEVEPLTETVKTNKCVMRITEISGQSRNSAFGNRTKNVHWYEMLYAIYVSTQ